MAVELRGPGGEPALAVSRDASKGGLLVLTGAPFEVGTKVSLTVSAPREGIAERALGGVVVRCEPNADDPQGLWRHCVAVQLDAPDEGLEGWLDELEPPPSFRRRTD